MNTPFIFKKCSKCGRWLVASKINFYKAKSGKYGLNSKCKECHNNQAKKYYKEHKESRNQYSKKYREKNKDYYKTYREEHKDYYAEYSKKYRKENKDYFQKYCKENKERYKDYNKTYRNTPQGQVVMFNAHIKRRQIQEQQGNGITTEQWLEMIKFFDFKCAYSEEYIGGNINVNRTIDHIVPLVKGGSHEIWNCVPMCRSYNSSKHDKDIEEWYPQQDFYSENRLNKIYE